MELPFSELTLIQKYSINKRSPWQVNFPSNWKWSSEKEKKDKTQIILKDKVFRFMGIVIGTEQTCWGRAS